MSTVPFHAAATKSPMKSRLFAHYDHRIDLYDNSPDGTERAKHRSLQSLDFREVSFNKALRAKTTGVTEHSEPRSEHRRTSHGPFRSIPSSSFHDPLATSGDGFGRVQGRIHNDLQAMLQGHGSAHLTMAGVQDSREAISSGHFGASCLSAGRIGTSFIGSVRRHRTSPVPERLFPVRDRRGPKARRL